MSAMLGGREEEGKQPITFRGHGAEARDLRKEQRASAGGGAPGTAAVDFGRHARPWREARGLTCLQARSATDAEDMAKLWAPQMQ